MKNIKQSLREPSVLASRLELESRAEGVNQNLMDSIAQESQQPISSRGPPFAQASVSGEVQMELYCWTSRTQSCSEKTGLPARTLLMGGGNINPHSVGFPFIARIVAKVKAALGCRVPMGYEDETGFHREATSGAGNILRTAGESPR